MPFAGCGVARLAAVWFPLQNPGIVSIPVGFLLGRLGALLSGRQETEAYDEFAVRSLVGADQS